MSKPQEKRPLPLWVDVTVVLVDLGLLAFNVTVNGPEGYPTTLALAGILGGYAGLRELVSRRSSGEDK